MAADTTDATRSIHRVFRGLSTLLVSGTITLGVVIAACGESRPAPATEGERLYNSRGCVACHGPGGSGGMAPAWKGIYGAQVTLNDDTVVTVDDAYLRLAITDPSAQRVKGYPMMPPNSLDDAEIQAIIDWIKTLK